MILNTLSGGLDSATVAYRSRKAQVKNVFFDYGQKNLVRERFAAVNVSHLLSQPLLIVELPRMEMLNDSNFWELSSSTNAALTSSFIPGRNMILLAHAASIAAKLGAEQVNVGFCRTSTNGRIKALGNILASNSWLSVMSTLFLAKRAAYPDTTLEFLRSMEAIARVATSHSISFRAPIADWTKARMKADLRSTTLGLEILKATWSCYEAGKIPCGFCPPCIERGSDNE